MVCIYCGGKTQVTNSRHQVRLNRNWRRRECYACQAVFTTEEAAELGTSLVVKRAEGHTQTAQPQRAGHPSTPKAPAGTHSPLQAFSRDKLFVSILRAVGHRTQPLEDAGALTATVVAKLVQNTTTAVVSPVDIIATTLATLQTFDTASAVQYRAYHRS
jgi:transcriptional regulator NrdR family protein